MVPYQIIKSRRKTLAIQITREGTVVVRSPLGLSEARIHSFVQSREPWIAKHLARREALPSLPPFSGEELHDLAQQARAALPERVAYFAPQIGVTWGRITIRAQRTRWGSCSSKGNLNFNCLLMLAPPQVRDYVVIHELCHRRELNHSARFWALVAQAMPDYRQARSWLKANGPALISRLEQK